MAFTGTWKMAATARQEQDQRVVHVADPAHAEVGPDSAAQGVTYASPAMLDPGLVNEYPGMEFVVTGGGRMIDTTPETHERDDTDHGSAIFGVFHEKQTQFADEQYSIQRFESFTTTDVNPVALQRGRNGLAENNPDGFRRGWDTAPFVEFRKFPIGERVHDHRIIFPDLPGDLPTAEPIGGQYPTSFGAVARAITNVNQRPQARREPPPMYGDLPGDGAPAYPSIVGDIGVVG